MFIVLQLYLLWIGWNQVPHYRAYSHFPFDWISWTNQVCSHPVPLALLILWVIPWHNKEQEHTVGQPSFKHCIISLVLKNHLFVKNKSKKESSYWDKITMAPQTLPCTDVNQSAMTLKNQLIRTISRSTCMYLFIFHLCFGLSFCCCLSTYFPHVSSTAFSFRSIFLLPRLYLRPNQFFFFSISSS